MLNISHKQATAYHPESNGAVKRLHHHLKDALRACATTATWSEELPFVLLRLRAQPREDTGLSPAEAVFGAQIVLPNKFLQNDEFSVDAIVKIFSKTLHVSAPSCLGTILAPICPASCQVSCSPPPSSGWPGSTPSAALRRPLRSPVPRLPLLHHQSWVAGQGGRRQPPRLAWPQTPCLAARVAAADRRVRTQAVLLQPSGSRFPTHWFLHLLFRRRHETVPEPFSYPGRRFLHARDRQRHHRCHRRGTRPVNGHHHRGWTSDLFSSQPRPELGGNPVDTCLHPW